MNILDETEINIIDDLVSLVLCLPMSYKNQTIFYRFTFLSGRPSLGRIAGPVRLLCTLVRDYNWRTKRCNRNKIGVNVLQSRGNQW